MNKLLPFAVILAVGMSLLSGCETAPKTEGEKQALTQESNTTIAQMKSVDPQVQSLINSSYGYAIFPSIGKGGLGVGGAYGRGEVYEQGRFVGFADLSQASIGLQAGGQEYSELILFQTPQALNRFKSGNFAFSADATAVALKSGAAATAQFKEGVAVFTLPKGGLMFEASIAGQKFSFEPASSTGSNTSGM